MKTKKKILWVPALDSRWKKRALIANKIDDARRVLNPNVRTSRCEIKWNCTKVACRNHISPKHSRDITQHVFDRLSTHLKVCSCLAHEAKVSCLSWWSLHIYATRSSCGRNSRSFISIFWRRCSPLKDRSRDNCTYIEQNFLCLSWPRRSKILYHFW